MSGEGAGEVAGRMTLGKAQQPSWDTGRSTYQLILLLAASLLLALPFLTTFNEFLTRMVMNLHLDTVLVDWVVPAEVRMVALLLRPLGIQASVSQAALYMQRGDFPIPVYINWNCVGWQSFILFALTLWTGLQGPYSRLTKFQCIALGLLGTFWMNLVRMTSVAVVAYHFGRLPAVIYHDYGGTILILLWLTFLWHVIFNHFVEEDYEWLETAS